MMYTILLSLITVGFSGDLPDALPTYNEVYNQAITENKSFSVLLISDYCPACPRATVHISTFRRYGLFTVVNISKYTNLGKMLIGWDDKRPNLRRYMVPQYIVYSKNSDGNWVTVRYIGADEIEKLVNFVNK